MTWICPRNKRTEGKWAPPAGNIQVRLSGGINDSRFLTRLFPHLLNVLGKFYHTMSLEPRATHRSMRFNWCTVATLNVQGTDSTGGIQKISTLNTHARFTEYFLLIPLASFASSWVYCYFETPTAVHPGPRKAWSKPPTRHGRVN